MAAHPYWRVVCMNAQNGGAYSSFAEVELRATAGGANQATGGTAIADSTFDGTTVAANAFDANTGTLWASGSGFPHYIGYYLAAGIDVVELMLRSRNDATFYAQCPTIFELQYSDTGTIWDIKHRESGVNWTGALQAKTFDVTGAGAAVTYDAGRPDLCTRLAMTRTVTIGAPQYTSGGANIIGGIVVGSGGSVVGGTGASPNAVGYLWPRGDGTPAGT